MNPSEADEHLSDRTVNKCASIAYNDLSYLNIGEIFIVNVYPFYESKSSNLNDVLLKIKKVSNSYYYREVFINLQIIQRLINNSKYVLLATGEIPKTISNEKEYQFILDSIVSYIESSIGTVYLATSKYKYKNKYILKDKYSYHICPNGNPKIIDRIKLHKVKSGKFLEILDGKEIILTL